MIVATILAVACLVLAIVNAVLHRSNYELQLQLDDAKQSKSRAYEERDKAWDAFDKIRNAAREVTKISGIVLGILVAIASTSIAQQQPNAPHDTRPWLSIFTTDLYKNVPHEAELVKAFDSDPSLRQVRSQCRWNHYTVSDPLYRDRFAKLIPPDRLPAVLLQRADGGYVYKSTGSNVPSSAAELFDEMAHYASLDPLNGPADSIEARPLNNWVRTQSGLDGVPDVDGPPGDCPDGRCPTPPSPDSSLPDASPDYAVPPPDSAELLGGGSNASRMPIRNMAAAAVFMVGLVIAVGVGLMFFIGLIVVVYLFSKVAK